MDIQAQLMKKIREEQVKNLNDKKVKGKYKIQIWFRSDRSLTKPIAFSLSAWQSGMRLHGGGDEMMFLCRKHKNAKDAMPAEVKFMASASNANLTKRGCGLFIPGENNINGTVVCPHCGIQHHEESIGDSVFYRLSADKAAAVLVDWYRKLDSCADIYAKYSPVDPRTVNMAKEQDIKTAREKKGLTIYPWTNILQDTANGATLESRFKAFILA